MGIADLRDAFDDAAAGALSCNGATHRYCGDGANSQILHFEGLWNDGTPFAIDSDPIDPQRSLQDAARDLAAKLIAERAKP